MKNEFSKMEREDYTDPQCPFCTDQYEKKPPVRPIPTARVLDKLDEFFSKNDYNGAERLLLYWLSEAQLGQDARGEFQLRNELMGFYRKQGKKDEAFENADRALNLAAELGILQSTAGATALLNAATVRKAFGKSDEAIPFFERARAIYETELKPNDPRLAGLYNNTSLALVDLCRFAEARTLYQKAILVLSATDGNEPELAVTYLNLANLEEAEKGLEAGAEAIETNLETAERYLNAPQPQNGNYAFVCEKCAPTFDYYGHFAFAAELTERATRIYERA
ncbi:MAG: tetratricopeptide repeat protein [Ruminococcaceae bacterium]|nr:tetratricopeptide repeat protein [Oscillospiraceae bacterium]